MRDYARPLAGVSSNIAFAKQRFDSFAAPAAKLCLMLMPVATVLCIVASDGRIDKATRDRAQAALQRFSPRFCTALGLQADMGLLTSRFLRIWDQGNHDISRSTEELREFRELMQAAFMEGCFFATKLWAAGPVVYW